NLLDESFDSSIINQNFEQRLDTEIRNLQPEWTQFKDDTTQQLADKATVKIFNEMPSPNQLLEGELGLVLGRAITPFASLLESIATTSQLTVRGIVKDLRDGDTIRVAYAMKNIYLGTNHAESAGMTDEGADEAVKNGRFFDIPSSEINKFRTTGFVKTGLTLLTGAPYVP